MQRVLATLAAAIALSACANVESTPSYLGMATGSIDAQGAAPVTGKQKQPPHAVQHVTSNRVLGAMAFQKVTGAEVDPSRLVGQRD
ncbi:MAG: hypothetical protein ABL907_07730 [Hyphomicrobium sp.]